MRVPADFFSRDTALKKISLLSFAYGALENRIQSLINIPTLNLVKSHKTQKPTLDCPAFIKTPPLDPPSGPASSCETPKPGTGSFENVRS